MTDHEQQEREAFIAAFARDGIYEPHEFKLDSNGGFSNPSLHDAFVGWMARAALSQAQEPVRPEAPVRIDIDRMDTSLKSGTVRVPPGLTLEEKREFILSHADQPDAQPAKGGEWNAALEKAAMMIEPDDSYSCGRERCQERQRCVDIIRSLKSTVPAPREVADDPATELAILCAAQYDETHGITATLRNDRIEELKRRLVNGDRVREIAEMHCDVVEEHEKDREWRFNYSGLQNFAVDLLAAQRKE